jgi:hypothetical protein
MHSKRGPKILIFSRCDVQKPDCYRRSGFYITVSMRLYVCLLLFKCHSHTIHTVPESRRFGTIVKNVTQVTAAYAAQYFGANHPVRFVLLLDHCIFSNGSVKAWPAGSGIEFGIGRKQGVMATCTVERTMLMDVIQWAGESPLGTVLTQNSVLVGGQQLLPFRISFNNFPGLVVVSYTFGLIGMPHIRKRKADK